MDRRLFLSALGGWPAAPLFAQAPEPRPRRKVSAGELYEAVSRQFPKRVGLPGLLQMEVSAPGLLLLPARNKLGASLAARPEGPGMSLLETGEVDVVFALRYERRDRSIRGHDAEVLDVRLPGLPPDFMRMLRQHLSQSAREGFGEIVLHQFTDRELALPDTMGFEPDRLTVLEDGLLVEFAPKARVPRGADTGR
ncbi:MAG TPA: DUF1439 domain-containing protein [Ramlibacter sp.]|uniref:DUF1439 domain-containing protein n=1 Tax=Ramlibacter sp. TaxID=1917967 RepID=UPI002ED42A90